MESLLERDAMGYLREWVGNFDFIVATLFLHAAA
jgi:hypothetical protein